MLGMGGAPGGGSMPPGGDGDAPGASGMMGGMGGGMPDPMGSYFRQLGLEGPKKHYTTKWVDIDKVGSAANVKLAENVYPKYIAVVSASFPLKQEMEEFRRALRQKSMYDLMLLIESEPEKIWKFAGLDVKRRVLDAHGKVVKDWDEKYTQEWLESLKRVNAMSAGDAPQDEKLSQYPGIINVGLVARLPKLARDQKYPDVRLQGIKDSLTKLDEASKNTSTPILSPQAQKLTGKDNYDPFNPFADSGGSDTGMPGAGMPGAGMPGGYGDSNQNSKMMRQMMGQRRGAGDSDAPGAANENEPPPEPIVADSCLLRFIDVNIDPGYTYEYQIRIKMLNPNYGKKKEVAFKSLAEKREIMTDWIPVDKPVRVKVPPMTLYYAVDEKPESRSAATKLEPANKERAALQIHKWFGYTLTAQDNAGSSAPVANWMIAERILAQRGEYIGHLLRMKVPIWVIDRDSYVLAKDSKRNKDVQLDFSTRPNQRAESAILVDFEGGKVSEKIGTKTIADTAPMQVLILTPEGQLVVHNGEADKADKDREERVKEHRKWLKEVERGKPNERSGQPGNLFDKGGGSRPPGAPGGT